MRALFSFIVACLLICCGVAHAEPPLLSLEVESVILNWQDEFVLQLSIYGPEKMQLPAVTIDGLDQFELQGTGKNLLQIPRGKTKKWILTYTLLASDTGNFKVGPAIIMHEGQSYRSNIVFLTIEGPVPARRRGADAQKKAEQEKEAPVDTPKKEKRTPAESPKEEKRPPVEEPKPVEKEKVKPAIVMSAAQIGDRILILTEARNKNPYQLQGVPVTVRLLSQLPVENLEFLKEADFPGFLRYDFPFTSKPKGEVVTYKNKNYASYELVKFLVFPLERGRIEIPPVHCELKVRVPSGAFPEADLKLVLERSSNLLHLNVSPSPVGAVVGDFVLKNEIVSDEPAAKILRLTLEGQGALSTFHFPELAGSGLVVRKVGASITARMQGENLISRKVQDLEITPHKSATSVVLQEIKVREFDPRTGALALLKLPKMKFTFPPPARTPKTETAFPKLTGGPLWILFVVAAIFAFLIAARHHQPVPPQSKLRLQGLFQNKNLKLHISKSAARILYQEIAIQIAQQERNGSSMTETIVKHLPQQEWMNIQRGLRKLEHIAYAPAKPVAVTYEEMKKLCEKIETLWIQ